MSQPSDSSDIHQALKLTADLPRPVKQFLQTMAAAGGVLSIPLGLLLWAYSPTDSVKATTLAISVVFFVPAFFVTKFILGLKAQIKDLKHEIELEKILFENNQKELVQRLESENGRAQDTLRSDFELLLKQKEAEIAEARAVVENNQKVLDIEIAHRIKSRRDHLKVLHGMVHRVRDICHMRPRSSIKSIGDAHTLFEKIAKAVLTDTRTLFLTHFRSIGIDVGEDVAVTLKLQFNKQMLLKADLGVTPEQLKERLGDEQYGLITFARDDVTAHIQNEEREVLGTIYSVEANSAFRQILNESWNGPAMFADNDLVKRKREQGYENQNVNWQKHYNSTIAVAVRYRSDIPLKTQRYGFLCIDSKNPNGLNLYEHEESFDLASHSADLLALVLYGMGLQHIPGNK